MSAGYVGIMDWAFLPVGVGIGAPSITQGHGFRGAGKVSYVNTIYQMLQERKLRDKRRLTLKSSLSDKIIRESITDRLYKHHLELERAHKKYMIEVAIATVLLAEL